MAAGAGDVVVLGAADFLVAVAGPRLSLRFAMHRSMNVLRLAPVSFCSSAPNLQVSAFSAVVRARTGVAIISRGSKVARAMFDAWS